jgi:hypothetical protein
MPSLLILYLSYYKNQNVHTFYPEGTEVKFEVPEHVLKQNVFISKVGNGVTPLPTKL